MSRDTQRIRHLNDRLRQDLLQGTTGKNTLVLTSGILSLGTDFSIAATQAVAEFDAFTEDNDPWGEHDFGSFVMDGRNVLWKIDYYDLQMEYGAENPAIASQTKRVLTIMLQEEY